MPSLPALRATLPSPTPCVTSSLTPDEIAAHRSRLCFEVEVVLKNGGYWQENAAPALQAAMMADWADELEDWTVEQVRWGLREYRRENPTRRPNPALISKLLKEQRGREMVAQQAVNAEAQQAALPAPGQHHETREERRVSAEAARAILAEVRASLTAGTQAEDETEAARRASAYPIHTKRPAEVAAE